MLCEKLDGTGLPRGEMQSAYVPDTAFTFLPMLILNSRIYLLFLSMQTQLLFRFKLNCICDQHECITILYVLVCTIAFAIGSMSRCVCSMAWGQTPLKSLYLLHKHVFLYRETVKTSILDVFAGPPDTGVFSPSVQKTLYDSQKLILSKIPQVNVTQYGIQSNAPIQNSY